LNKKMFYDRAAYFLFQENSKLEGILVFFKDTVLATSNKSKASAIIFIELGALIFAILTSINPID